MSNSALAGLRVVDFTHFIAGPICTMVLADLGADVIKVESPSGDTFRNFRPLTHGEGAPFLWCNRNKRGITLDLGKEAGREIARELIAGADVLVENFSSGVMKRYGLDFPSLEKSNSRLIYCSISAYGRTGALADRVGFDPVVQAEVGFMSMNGHPDQEGTRTGPAVMDISTGMMASNAILGALVARGRTGLGQYVEVALYDTAVTMLGFHAMSCLVSGVNPHRFSNTSTDNAPMGMFQAADGPFYLACANDGLFRRLAIDVVGHPPLLANEDFATPAARVRNRLQLTKVLNGFFAGDKREAWLARMRACGVPAGAPLTVEEAMRSPELKERGLLSHIPHPKAGEIPNIALPLRLAGTPTVPPVAAPVLGQHTREVLADVLGYDSARIASLAMAGALGPGKA